MKIFQRRGATSLAIIIGGLAILGLSQLPWISFSYRDILGSGQAHSSGSAASPQVAASATVMLAAGILLTLAGKVLQRIALATAALAGTLAAVSAATFATATDTHRGIAQSSLAVSGEITSDITVTVWPWVTAAVALLSAMGWAYGAWKAPTWVRRSARYETHHTAAESSNPATRARADWDLISGGIDPSEGSVNESDEGPVSDHRPG